MIIFEQVDIGPFKGLDFEIGPGVSCKIITETDHEKSLLVRAMLGLEKPLRGRVLLLGRDMATASEPQRLELYRRIGMVWQSGGFVSNIKIYENVMLPMWYHYGYGYADVKERVLEIYAFLALVPPEKLPSYLWSSPGQLPTYQRRLLNLARCLVAKPELMIYDTLFKGLGPQLAMRVRRLTHDFHKEQKDRTSVYIGSDKAGLSDIATDMELTHRGEGYSL